MYECRTLENIEFEVLHGAFLRAFSDYTIKIDMPFEKFKNMLIRRGYFPEFSVGTFVNSDLIGFIFNGYRNWRGMPSLYDVGTGVVPEYRQKGITGKAFERIAGIVKEKNISQYVLEVIQTNSAAVELYKKQGFEVTRNFDCFQLKKNDFNYNFVSRGSAFPNELVLKKNFIIRFPARLSTEEFERFSIFTDDMPSWQNSFESIHSTLDNFIYVVVEGTDETAGYGIIEKMTGDIPQLAVNKKYRGHGVGAAILTALINKTESEKITVINVNSENKTLREFLKKNGFNCFCSQYEMQLKF